MLLVIDVGNTNIVFGVFDNESLVGSWRMSTVVEKTSDEIGILLSQYLNLSDISTKDIEGVIISSVVPPIMYSLENAIKRYVGKEPIIVSYKTPLNIKVSIDNPSELGADRLVNAYAALEIYKKDLIVVDFGTATTFCAMTKDREYLGGIICAGIKISMEALFNKASKLPRIEIAKPPKIIGKNTLNAMQSGAVYGYVGQVDYIVRGMKEELPNATVVATGGLARLISKESKTIDFVNSALTLDGLRLIYKNTEVTK